MKKQYFKCILKTDIVVNASLATEGNMTTLDYIPGSNFLGIVAGKLYSEGKLSNEELYDVFHSGKVSFGDALISKNNNVSYSVPFSLFQDKLNKGLGEEDKKTWVHHLLNNERPKNDNGFIQLKQQRGGFFNSQNGFIKSVEKQFSLKSAHNRDERRSAEGKMFGFESIKKGQEFIFSINFEDDNYIDIVSDALIGDKRIGKSKTAQFGQVFIEKVDNVNSVKNGDIENNQLVIYADSNLCFLNELGQSTYQPKLSDFGIECLDCKIDWDLSQVRTYSYSPWNTQRNTSNTQINTISKGSVIIIDTRGENIEISRLKTQVGEHIAEGLGRIIYNPELTDENKKLLDSIKLDDIKTSTFLGDFLHSKLKLEDIDLKIGEAVIAVIDANKLLTHKDITPSQWGGIRTKATNAKNLDLLIKELFEKSEGYLTHGVADENIWGKNRGARREALLKVINDNRELGTKFVARLAADMAKLNKK